MKRWLLLSAGLAVFLGGCGVREKVLEPQAVLRTEEVRIETETEGRIFVYVCGAVQNAGVYSFKEGARAFQALEAAGGFRDDAERELFNLALELEDGQMLRIPSQEETGDAAYAAGAGHALSGMPEGDFYGDSSAADDGRVNINTADEQLLMTLPGIGQARAAEIVAWRNEHGGFEDISQLRRVNGIGDKIFEKLQDLITV